MPTILANILKFLFHPSTLIAMFAAGSMWFFMHTIQQNKDLKQELNNTKGQIEELHNQMVLQQGDMDKLLDITRKNSKVRQREADVNSKIAEIPKTSTDRPFSNPDLLNAAGMLREYQSSEQSTTNSNN